MGQADDRRGRTAEFIIKSDEFKKAVRETCTVLKEDAKDRGHSLDRLFKGVVRESLVLRLKLETELPRMEREIMRYLDALVKERDRLDALLVIRPMETAPRDGTWIMLWSRYCDKDYVNEEPIEELPEVVAWQGEKPIWMTVRGERYEEEYIRFVGWTPVPKPVRKKAT